MATLAQKKRSPDVRSLGITLGAAGAVVCLVEQGRLPVGLAFLFAGAACYYVGLQWE